MNRFPLVVVLLSVALAGASLSASADPEARPLPFGASAQVLASAPADEYFYGLGDSRNTYMGGGIDLDACATNGAAPKVNQAYVWGLAKSGRNLFFGTMANTDTLVLSGYLGQTNAAVNYYRVAEYGEGVFGRTLGLPGVAGDWRPPRLYRYDLDSGLCLDLVDDLPPADRARLGAVLGIRAGGAVPPGARNPDGLAVLAGPMLQAERGCAFFFFNGTTGAFLGSMELPRYTNIRRFVEVNGDLYAPVQLADASGAVIRWINNPAATNYPFRLVEVGALDQGGADICAHEGRLFVTTWPSLLERARVPGSGVQPEDLFLKAVGLWMSPVVPETGLPGGSAWTKVWNVNDYEPDRAIAASYGGGALASFDGWLYFGTLHVPLLSTLVHAIAAGDYARAATSTPEQVSAYLAERMPRTHRAASLFRGRAFRAPAVVAGITLTPGGEFQLLYGYTNMWAYDLEAKTWSQPPNNLGAPRMGGPGFGNVNNAYAWVMEVFQNDLYLGTFDFTFPSTEEACAAAATNPLTTVGGDLLRLPSSRARAFEPVSLGGLGNIANYGFRTMVSTPGALYLGTANPRNLLVHKPGLPAGGWELLAFTRPRPAPFDQDGDRKADFSAATASGVATWASLGGAWTNQPVPLGARLAAADYDGDGKTDLGYMEGGTGAWFGWLTASRGARARLVRWIGEGLFPVPADMDGDGNGDCVVWRASDSTLTWLSSRTGKGQSARPPAHPLLPAPADYDGNGKAEAAWYGAASGRWYRQPRAGAAVEPVPLWPRVKAGLPMPADFGGDGKADYALFEKAAGLVHVWDSASRVHVVLGPRPGWLPACADYDGDGKADEGWYHARTRRLYIRYSASGLDETLDLAAVLPEGARPLMAPRTFR